MGNAAKEGKRHSAYLSLIGLMMVFHPVCCISDHITLNVISMAWRASCIHRSMKTTLHQPEDLVSRLSSSAYWRCINNTAGELYHQPLLLAIMLSVILESNSHSRCRILEVSAYQLSLHVSHLIEMLERNSRRLSNPTLAPSG
jgi:hypothetical protein